MNDILTVFGRFGPVVCVLLALWLVVGLAAGTAQAQEGNHAGLVVVHGDGQVETRCVRFDEPTISGLVLLERSGLDVNYSTQSGGVTMCSLDGEGCDFPQESCFCQCEGIGTCTYWSYHSQEEGGTWRYNPIGASLAEIEDGDVEGWVWGAGNTSAAPAPPALSFEEICEAPAGAAQTSPTAPTSAQPGAPPSVEATPPALGATPSPTAAPVVSPAEAAPPTGIPPSYALFGVIVAALLGLLWWQRH